MAGQSLEEGTLRRRSWSPRTHLTKSLRGAARVWTVSRDSGDALIILNREVTVIIRVLGRILQATLWRRESSGQ